MMSPIRAILTMAVAGLAILTYSAVPVLSQDNKESPSNPGVVLKVTQRRIEESKKGYSKFLLKDRQLITALFDPKGKFLIEGEPDSPRGKLIRAVQKKDDKQPLQMVAEAWYEARVSGKRVQKGSTITYAALTDTVEEMVKLTIKSVPGSAKVYIREDGNYVGKTEVRRWVAPGKIWIRLTRENYADCEKEIDVPTKNYTHTETLKKK